MYVELVDALRCPVPHEDSWLVAAAGRTERRHIVQGTLGCPVCTAQYPIRNGVADFRRSQPSRGDDLPGAPEQIAASEGQSTTVSDEPLRLAAFLGLDDGQGVVLMLGGWAAHARGLRELVDVNMLVVDPPQLMPGEPGVSVLRCDGVLPLAAGMARGTVLDASPDVARVASAVRATRVGGRVVGPVSITVPSGVRELARDDRVWVAERERDLPIITLTSRTRAAS